jgi:hypothetical protein
LGLAGCKNDYRTGVLFAPLDNQKVIALTDMIYSSKNT